MGKNVRSWGFLQVKNIARGSPPAMGGTGGGSTLPEGLA